MKHYFAALALLLMVSSPAWAQPTDSIYRVDETDVLNDLKAHAYNYSHKMINDWAYPEKCYRLVERARGSDIKGTTEFRHRELQGIPGAKYDEEREEYVVTLDQAAQFCDRLESEYGNPLAQKALAEIAAKDDGVTTRGTMVDAYNLGKAAGDWSNATTAAEDCDRDVQALQESHADKSHAVIVGGKSITIANAKDTVCARFHVDANERKAAMDAHKAREQAKAEAERKAAEEAEKKEEARILKEYKDAGVAGEKLEFLQGNNVVGFGGKDLTIKQEAATSVFFTAYVGEELVEVTKYRFNGNKLVGTSTKTYSKYLVGVNDSRLYR